MIDAQSRNAYYEVSKILKYISKTLNGKIPSNLINYFEENKAEDYNFEIDPEKSIEEQKTLPETNEILDILYRDYIYSEEYEKEIKDENKEELIEEYNEKISFENNQSKETENIGMKSISIVEYKETFFTKIMHKIRSLLWKINY